MDIAITYKPSVVTKLCINDCDADMKTSAFLRSDQDIDLAYPRLPNGLERAVEVMV